MRPLRPKRRPLRNDRRGIEGFFEEILALIVVVIAVGAFITSAYSSYLAYERQNALGTLHDDCFRFCRALRSFDPIVEKGVIFQESCAGWLDREKLDALNISVLRAGLSTPHHFNVSVTDRVTGEEWTLGERPPAGSVQKAIVTSAILISGPDGRRHPGSLEVMMWG
jgi:hypothetical protein